MKRRCRLLLPIFVWTVLTVVSVAGNDTFATFDPALETRANQWMQRNNALHFTENKGQMTDMGGNPVPFVFFKTEMPGANIFITNQGLTYVFFRAEEKNGKVEESEKIKSEEKIKGEWNRVDMKLTGARITKENSIAENPLPEVFNYYLGHLPAGKAGCQNGISGVKQYQKITVKNIYPGIDWVIYSDEKKKGLKYDFVLHPGANPNQIILHYLGADTIKNINRNTLRIKTKLGEIQEGELISYQLDEEGKPSEVKSWYHIRENKVSFKFKNFVSGKTIIIDPPVQLLQWGTYYGGNDFDGPLGIVSDNNGNVFVSGYTWSLNFPLQNPGGGTYYQGTLSGSRDAFILKFNNNGVRQWATYYGGSADEYSFGIDVDISGNIFITGWTSSSNFPTFNPGGGAYYQAANAGQLETFIVKFNNAGIPVWATYYGDAGYDYGYAITVDDSGNIFITGSTGSTNFPLQNPGGGVYYQPTFGGSFSDVFIIKFDNAGVRQWATYYGGASNDEGFAITSDTSGNIFLTGTSASANFPTFNPGGGAYYQAANGGTSGNIFILKFNNTGVRQWATYYPANGNDEGRGVAVDNTGNLFLTGRVTSTNLPTINPGGGAYFQSTFGGGGAYGDMCVMKFTNSGICQWATYYGGSGGDKGYGITADVSGNIYIGGESYSPNINTLNPGGGVYFDGTYSGGAFGPTEIFILQLDNSGVVQWATYYGGAGKTGEDYSTAVTVNSSGCLLVTGEFKGASVSVNTQNPGGGAYYQASKSASDDGFVLKFCPSSTALTTTIIPTHVVCNSQCTGTAGANPSGGTPPYTYSWSSGGQNTQTATGLCFGSYTVIVTDAVGSTTMTAVSITQPTLLTVTAASTNSTCGNTNGTTTATASGGAGGYTYSWNPSGQTIQTVTGLGAGNYTLTVTDVNGCSAMQVVAVISSGSITSASQSASICSGSTYTLPGGTVVSTAGTYTSTLISVNGCDSIITTTLTVNPSPMAAAFSNVTIAQGQSVTLTASGGAPNNSGYSWNSGASGSSIMVSPPTTTIYCVTVTDANNCTDTACVTVTVEPLDCSTAGDLYLPNAFSPNGDGENDKLQIYYGNFKCIKTFKLIIYNRWGEKVFETKNPIAEWDGAYKGKLHSTAVFVYYWEAAFINGEKITKKGNISLIR